MTVKAPNHSQNPMAKPSAGSTNLDAWSMKEPDVGKRQVASLRTDNIAKAIVQTKGYPMRIPGAPPDRKAYENQYEFSLQKFK